MKLWILAFSLSALVAQARPADQDVVQALRALVAAKQWTEFDARLASVDADDPAWERVAPVVYQAGIARNDLPSVITRLQLVADKTNKPSIRAAARIVIGRVHRRQGDRAAAVKALAEAKGAAPDSQYAEEATGLIYEIEHLSPGMQAPAIDAKSRTGQNVSLTALHGKPVVLVFWGST